MFDSLAIPWTVALQAPLSMGFPKQEYWSGFPFFFSKGSSQLRDRTCVSCIGRQNRYHWATWAAELCEYVTFYGKDCISQAVLVVKYHLPKQGTQVWSLVWVPHASELLSLCASHNYWAPSAATTEARAPKAYPPQQEKPLQWEARELQWRVDIVHCN